MDENASATKKFLLELGFFIGIVIAVVLTVIDVVFGIFRYAYGRLVQGRPNFNPYADIASIWKAIGRHLSYLGKVVFMPAFRASVRKNRTRMHQQTMRAREAFRQTHNTRVFDDFDYVDATTVLAMMWPVLFCGWLLVEIIVGIVFMIGSWGYVRYYGVAEHVTTPVVIAKPVFQPTIADKQETDYGSWFSEGEAFAQASRPEFLNLALLSDTGTVRYSQHHIGVLTAFAPLGFSEWVINPHVESGRVTFRDQNRNEFTVNPGQAFMFENYKSQVFTFGPQGQLMAVRGEQFTTEMK